MVLMRLQCVLPRASWQVYASFMPESHRSDELKRMRPCKQSCDSISKRDNEEREATADVRPISLLRIPLLRFVDSTFPGNSPWAWKFHPLKLRFCLSKTLRNPES